MFSPERYTAAHEGAILADRSDRGRIRLTGADRLGYLHGVLTNDISALTPGTGCYAALLTPQGRMISDMRVFELGDAVLIDVPGEMTSRVAAHLSDFIFSEDVAVEEATAATAHLTVIGPASQKALSLRPLRAFENRRITFADVDIMACGNDEFGVPAVDVFVESSNREVVLRALTDAGIASAQDEILETLRIEAGIPRFGIDMDQNTIPLEAGIEDRAISLTKGCYVGQEVIIRVLHRGHGRVARRLVGLIFPAEAQVPARGARLHSGDRQVGAVTSATWSPALGRPVALGYVHRDFVEPGTIVKAGDHSATVSALPFTVSAAQ